MNSKNKKLFELIIPGIITFLILMFVFKREGIAPFGSSSLVFFDADIQYLDFFCYLKDVINGKNMVIYTFSKTLGGTNIAVFSYYLTSPFNILVVFFNKEELHNFFDLTVAFKLSLASITFTYFTAKRFGYNKKYSFIYSMLGVSYGLCQYNLAQSSNIMWLDGVYMLPLMLLEISNLVNRKKSYLVFVSSLSILFNWYTGLINCVFSAFWFLFEYLLQMVSKKNFKYFILCIKKYVIHMVLCLLISSILLLPTVSALKKSTRGTLHFEELFNFTPIGEIPSFILKYTYGSQSEYGSVALFCGSLTLILAIYTIINKKINLKKRIVLGSFFALTILIYYFHPLDIMFCLFQGVSSYWYRYSYVTCFSILFIAYYGLKQINDKNDLKLLFKVAISYTILLLILNYSINNGNINNVYLFAFMLNLITLSFILSNLNLKKKIFVNISSACFIILSLLDITINTDLLVDSYSSNNVLSNNQYIKEEKDAINKIKMLDDSYFRISQTSTRNTDDSNQTANYNEALAYGYASISGYTSSPDDIQRNFLDKLGYRKNGDNMCITNTSILGADSLLGVKYILSDYKINGLTKVSDDKYNNKSIYLNPYALPFSFVYNDKGYEVKETSNPFEYQNELYKELFGIEEDIYSPLEYSIISSDDNITKLKIDVKNDDIAIYGNIPWERESSALIYVNDEFITKYSCWLSPSVFYIRNYNNDCIVSVKTTSDNFDFNKAEFYALNPDVLSKYKEIAEGNKVSSLSINKDKITLSANASKTDRLFISIPYDSNFRITVNGKAAETKLIGDALYSIKLEEGNNIIVMYYHVTSLDIGIIISMITLIGICCYYSLNRKYYYKYLY